ncbi:MAG TPA: glycosyltransferase [bacterium]|nr:glycosyltransferase [bacterium]
MPVKNTRVNCITPDYPPMKGGVARYLSSLSAASGFRMNVYVPIEHPEPVGSEVKKIKFWWPVWPKWLPLVKRILDLKREGGLLVSHVFPVGTAAWLARLLGGPEYVLLFHGTDLQRVKSAWKLWLLKRVCGRARAMVVNSQATGRILTRFIPGAHYSVITPGVWPGQKKDKVLGREELGLDEQTKVVLAVCRLVDRKGIDTLIQAMEQLRAQFPEAQLAVVGDGPLYKAWSDLAELLQVPVTWVRRADDELVNKWYAAADIFCLPGQEKADDIEGFGIVYLEAATHGLPVIAGQGGGVAEAVLDGVTGLVVPPAVESVKQALARLLNNASLREQMGRAGRQRALSEFDWADRWIDFDKLINGSSIVDFKNDMAVVIPCWNHARELDLTLQALSQQTLQPAEVLVVDDASEDDPRSVVMKYQDRLPIKYLRLEKNSGAPAARNKGAELTKSEFILFLDAEVVLRPQALWLMREALEKEPDAALAYGDFYWSYKLFKARDWDVSALRRINYIHTTALIRRNQLIPFDESLKKFQDWDLWLSVAGRGSRGVYIPQVLFKVLCERQAGMSKWLPAFVYGLPWPIFGWTPKTVSGYKKAEQIIRAKHGI